MNTSYCQKVCVWGGGRGVEIPLAPPPRALCFNVHFFFPVLQYLWQRGKKWFHQGNRKSEEVYALILTKKTDLVDMTKR